LFDVSGALLINVDGHDIAVCASGSDIVVEVRNPRGLLKQAGSPIRGRRIVRAAAARLRDLGLTLTVSRNGTAVLMLGAQARTTLLGRLLGVKNVALVAGKRRQ
jgi:hypothetical protein